MPRRAEAAPADESDRLREVQIVPAADSGGTVTAALSMTVPLHARTSKADASGVNAPAGNDLVPTLALSETEEVSTSDIAATFDDNSSRTRGV